MFYRIARYANYLTMVFWRFLEGSVESFPAGASTLNNWAENRKDISTEKLYLGNLLSELRWDRNKLQQNIEKIEENRKFVDEILQHANKNNNRKDTLFRKVFQISDMVDFVPQNITYKTLINSGDSGAAILDLTSNKIPSRKITRITFFIIYF